MQKRFRKICLTAAVALATGLTSIASAAGAAPAPAGSQGPTLHSTTAPLPGVVRVKLQPEVAAALAGRLNHGKITAEQGRALRTGVQQLDATLGRIKGATVRRVFTAPKGREAEHQKFGLDLWYEITFNPAMAPQEARRLLEATAGVQKASTRVPLTLFDGGDKARYVVAPAPSKAPSATMPFNDPRLPDQWHYDNRAQLGGSIAGADINLFEAWKTETGKSHVVVAIVDGGIDFTHEDLADAMWVNQAEMNGTPGVDDDGNGFIDDVYGFNFCTFDGTIYPQNHGTHVAGTVGAINNNGVGVAGVAGGDGTPGSGVRLMSCQVFDPRSSAGEGDFAAALIYAADMGATIANCSWGWEADGYYEEDVLDAVRYFTRTARSDNMTGGLCFFAAGNSGAYGTHYPGSMEEAVAVAAMTAEYLPATYSNHGEWVDVTAPGGDVDFNQMLGVLSTLPNNSYGYSEGTSMATPHVTGIAALVLSKYGSKSMINENLRQQIITSVNDFYTFNPQVTGWFGSGYVDAAKALAWNRGTPPERITDLTVIPSQDNALLRWTIPSSPSGSVNSHVIFYSKAPFTAESTDGCATVVVDTKFASPGQAMEYELTGLEPLTTYYIAVQALDRWNNASELSPIVEATTNAGPHMTINRNSMTIQSADGKKWNTSKFVIGNTAEGLLRWEAELRTVSSAISAYSTTPQQLATVPYRGHAAIQPCATQQEPVAAIEEFMEDDYPKNITNMERLYSYIGDLDQSLPNSLAQLITVDPALYPDGFNLTHVRLEGTYGVGPTIEIYRSGGTLSASTLLSTTVVDENFTTYYYDHQLSECSWFAPGESFYIVVHFTNYESRNYPLGLAVGNGTNTAAQAYLSNDLGKTWVLLREALRGSNYESLGDTATWAVHAVSKFPDWSQVLSLTPDHGQVAGGEQQTVEVTNNGTRLPNGTYRTRIRFKTNESEPNTLTITPAIVVSGQEPDVTYNKIVQFGNLLVGQKKTVTINLVNKGYGTFAGSDRFSGIYSDKISCSNPNFKGPEYLQNGLPARSTTPVELTFAPTEAGSHSGQVILTDKAGRQVKINVQGAATEPAHMVLEPATVEVGDLDVADDTGVETSFEIRNDGKYPLQFVMPKYTDETLDEIASSNTHRFGYNWLSNLYGSTAVTYTPAPELIGAIDVKGDFGDYNYFSRPLDMGFDFPFYGRKYNKIYVSSYGILSFDVYDGGYMHWPLNEATDYYLGGLGIISIYGCEAQFDSKSQVLCGHSDGKFVVHYKDVLVSVYDKEYTRASYHIALSPNGDIEMAFDQHTAADVFQQGSPLWVGIADPDMTDPLTVTSSKHTTMSFWYDDDSEEANRYRYLNSGTAFLFKAPRPDMIKSISPASGIVPSGESLTIKARVAANNQMVAGTTQTDLVIMSNDLTSPTTLLTFNANIVGELYPELAIETDKVDFGRAFRTSTVRTTLAVRNHGRAPLTITGVTFEGGKFTSDFTQPIVVESGLSKDLLLTMPTTAEGTLTDRLTITTTAGERTVEVTGTVIGVPTIDLGYDKVDETMASGERKSVPLSVTNNGNEPLVYSLVVGNHMSYNPAYSDDAVTTYKYTASADDPSARRPWVDIETNGLGTHYNYTYFITKDHVDIELPFEFPYFGKMHKKLTIVDSGFITFCEHGDEGRWPEPPIDFPYSTDYTAVIAPYWGLHTMDISSTAGIYYYTSDSQAVISFVEYGNSLNYGVSYQVVLRPDGSFTFNYKAANEYAIIYSPFGFNGISNHDATDGVMLPGRYLKLDTSINFSPVVDITLAPGETQQADVALVADEMAGNYTSTIEVTSNVPGRETLSVPVNLAITGEPAPVFPADITVEQVAGHVAMLNDELSINTGAMWYVPFEIGNEGSATFTVANVKMTCSKYEGENMFTLYYYGKYVNIWTGEETYGWAPYNGDAIEVGRSPLRMAIPICMSDYSQVAWQTPGVYTACLEFDIQGVEGLTRKVLNINIVITEQPNLAIDRTEINLEKVADDYVGTEQFTITNPAGGSTLHYSLRVDATGLGEEVPDLGDFAMPAAAKLPAGQRVDSDMTAIELPRVASIDGKKVKPNEVGNSTFIYDNPTPEMFTYNRSLYWPALASSNAAYNYGTTTTYGTYKAATRYEGPAGGFNISHIYTMYHPFNLDNTDLKVEIYNGNPQITDDVLSSGTYHIGTVETQKYENVVSCIELDRPVFISEGQVFYVVVTYPVGQEFPAGLVVKEEAFVSDRYLGYWDTFGWFDVGALFNDAYGSLGYVCTCLETVEGDAWVKFLNADGSVSSTAEGSVEPDASATVQLRLTAADSPKDLGNKAMIVVKSNDPKASVVNIPVYLNRNGKPTVACDMRNVALDENASAEIALTVVDPDGDDFSLLLNDNGGISRITTVTPTADSDATVDIDDSGLTATVKNAPQGATVRVQLAASYGDAGSYILTLYAIDSANHEGSASVAYNVAHVNRAPVAVEYPEIAVAVGQSYGPINLAELFTDPDGDEMTYEVALGAGMQRIELYRSGNKLIINALRSGISTITVTATDSNGDTGTNELRVDSRVDGLDASSALATGVEVRPNPVVETLYITPGDLAGRLTLRIYNAAGALALSQMADAPADGTPVALGVGHLPSGVYVLNIADASGRTASLLLIKE